MLRTKLTLSTLAATIVLAGCSTQMTQPVQKDVSATKVEAVKVDSNIVDLGNKDGASIKVNVGLSKSSSPFGIKAITQGYQVNLSGADLELVLYKQSPNTKLNPEVRHNAGQDGAANTIVKPFLSPTFPLTVTFKGLAPASGPAAQDYFVSARLYEAPKDFSTPTQVNISGQTTPDKTGTVNLALGMNFDSLQLSENDIVRIDTGSGPIAYRVTGAITSTSFNVSLIGAGNIPTGPSSDTTTSPNSFVLRSNIVSFGALGSSAAGEGQANSNGMQQGGGTAGSIGNPSVPSSEEFVSILPNGFLVLNGDRTPGITINSSTPGTNNDYDVQIQVRADKKAEVAGTVSVIGGAPDNQAEDITL